MFPSLLLGNRTFPFPSALNLVTPCHHHSTLRIAQAFKPSTVHLFKIRNSNLRVPNLWLQSQLYPKQLLRTRQTSYRLLQSSEGCSPKHDDHARLIQKKAHECKPSLESQQNGKYTRASPMVSKLWNRGNELRSVLFTFSL